MNINKGVKNLSNANVITVIKQLKEALKLGKTTHNHGLVELIV